MRQSMEILALAPTDDNEDVDYVEAEVTYTAIRHRAEPDVGYTRPWHEVSVYALTFDGEDIWVYNDEDTIIERVQEALDND